MLVSYPYPRTPTYLRAEGSVAPRRGVVKWLVCCVGRSVVGWVVLPPPCMGVGDVAPLAGGRLSGWYDLVFVSIFYN